MLDRLDTETLQTKFQGKKGLLESVFQEFSKSVENMFPEMRLALDNRDWSSLGYMIHTLKGNAALIGAGRMVNLALAMEKASAQADANYLVSWLPELEQEARSTLIELRQFIESL